jgi:hypothetical protein
MRKLPLSVAVSTALHAAAVVWVAARPAARPVASPDAATTPIEVIPVAPAPEIEPIEATLLDPPSAPPERRAALTAPPTRPDPPRAPARPPSESPPSPSPSPSSSAPAAGAIVVPGAGTSPETPPSRSPWLAMRGQDRPNLALPAGRWDPLDHAPAGTRPEKQRRTGILHESGSGTHETDQGGFTAKVNRDGSVELHDNPSASIRLALPSLKGIGRAISDWYEAPKGTYGETAEAPMSKYYQLSVGPTTDQGDEAHPEHIPKETAKTAIIPVFAGRLEFTDWLMRRKGIDPYASRKLKILDATRDERVQIGNRHRADQLAMTPQIIQRNLERLWAAIPDTAARKQALFDLWDECVETGDPAVVAAAAAARRLVIAFIRARFPAGSPDAFTAAELDAVARTKRSKATFQPYEQ